MQREKLKKLKKIFPKPLFTTLANKEKYLKRNSETLRKTFSRKSPSAFKTNTEKIKIKSRKTKPP